MILCLLLATLSFCSDQNEQADYELNILVFTKTLGYRHESISAGVKMLRQLCSENSIGLTHSEGGIAFSPDILARYDAVVFLSTTGDVLNDQQQRAFEDFIRSGRGFVGIHSAAATEYDWSWYGRMLGAIFESHPEPQNANVMIIDTTHVSTENLPAEWHHYDEWYNFNYELDGKTVIALLDESTYSGGAHGYHPISWYKEYEGGRSFYTGLGHTNECYSDPFFIDHIRGALKYAIGLDKF